MQKQMPAGPWVAAVDASGSITDTPDEISESNCPELCALPPKRCLKNGQLNQQQKFGSRIICKVCNLSQSHCSMISQRVDHRDHRLCSRTQSRFAATQTHCAAASRPFWLRRVSAVSNGRNHKPGSDYCQEDPRNDGHFMFRAVPRGLILVGFIWLEDPTMGYDIGVGRPAQTSVLFSTRAPMCP